ncbi:11221_t:CDS:2 [Diversispora eburnea]|uniref:11221_t:CDS:1 n=1 Tax=Diversispora eburnea TaxID=1213867 RepID=A0A9N9C9F7_9GLOM|nr:11221_t:CDS:2 [Diversispora eburnea]
MSFSGRTSTLVTIPTDRGYDYGRYYELNSANSSFSQIFPYFDSR